VALLVTALTGLAGQVAGLTAQSEPFEHRSGCMGIDPIAVVERLFDRFVERDVPIRRFRIYGAESTGKGTSGDQIL